MIYSLINPRSFNWTKVYIFEMLPILLYSVSCYNFWDKIAIVQTIYIPKLYKHWFLQMRHAAGCKKYNCKHSSSHFGLRVIVVMPVCFFVFHCCCCCCFTNQSVDKWSGKVFVSTSSFLYAFMAYNNLIYKWAMFLRWTLPNDQSLCISKWCR